MRPDNDNRKDALVKKNMYEKNIKNIYDVDFILDNRNQVVDMWRKDLGLKSSRLTMETFNDLYTILTP